MASSTSFDPDIARFNLELVDRNINNLESLRVGTQSILHTVGYFERFYTEFDLKKLNETVETSLRAIRDDLVTMRRNCAENPKCPKFSKWVEEKYKHVEETTSYYHESTLENVVKHISDSTSLSDNVHKLAGEINDLLRAGDTPLTPASSSSTPPVVAPIRTRAPTKEQLARVERARKELANATIDAYKKLARCDITEISWLCYNEETPMGILENNDLVVESRKFMHLEPEDIPLLEEREKRLLRELGRSLEAAIARIPGQGPNVKLTKFFQLLMSKDRV
jgi:hypothetical protein